ncbi:FAD-linked sulfhydryl oxidase ERV2 [Smittium mucronatum]|uniref:Sulfhydryl oxidase n=1 Tax=Smittium mucronatum TaxID=133383 RepID=A0A1R0H2H6_9FUNG|nr:FAD-linked sulfhydryl oxidase ERV2 [Smittium mucronatum]
MSMSKRLSFKVYLFLALTMIIIVGVFGRGWFSEPKPQPPAAAAKQFKTSSSSSELQSPKFDFPQIDGGQALMGKMVNETLRKQLGRSTWYTLHVMASRYPTDPTPDEQNIMSSYFNILSYLYPCGDWYVSLFSSTLPFFFPPVINMVSRVDSRNDFEQWLCTFHNAVNVRLGKDTVDCSGVHDLYDCGCGPDLVRYKPEADANPNA